MGWFRRSAREKILADISFGKRGEILSGSGTSNRRDSSPSSGSQSSGGKGFLIVFFIFILLVGGVFLWGYLSSEAGQRTLQDLKSTAQRWLNLDPISDFFAGVFSTGSGDYFSTNINSSSSKKGIDLEDFRSITGDVVPGGQAFDLLYDISYDNVPSSSSYEGNFYCHFNTSKKDPIPNEERFGEIIPENPSTIRKGSTTLCRIAAEQTADLDGAYTFYGSFSFNTETLDATLPVYFIPGELADQLGDDDFFDVYDLGLSQSDLEVVYNGEPISVAIGVGGEGEEQQPVIVRSGDTLSYNTVGITLTNEWNGDIESLDSFTLSLPDGVTLNDELNLNPDTGTPTTSCPFLSAGREGRENTYIMDDSVRENLFTNYIQNNAFFGRSNYRTFQCWISVDPEIFSDAPYVVKDYSVDIGYRYTTEEQQATISIVPTGDSLVVKQEIIQ